MENQDIDAAIKNWSIHAPDRDGCVYLETRAGDAIHLTKLGRHRDVLEKLADWCSLHDPE